MSMFVRRRNRSKIFKAAFVVTGVIAGLFSLALALGVVGLGFSFLADGGGNHLNLRILVACLVCLVVSVLAGSIAKRSFERAIFD